MHTIKSKSTQIADKRQKSLCNDTGFLTHMKNFYLCELGKRKSMSLNMQYFSQGFHFPVASLKKL